jgi:hypothetical protein
MSIIRNYIIYKSILRFIILILISYFSSILINEYKYIGNSELFKIIQFICLTNFDFI